MTLNERTLSSKTADESFRSAYAALGGRMRALADADGDLYVPSVAPAGPVDFIFVAMEPSLGGARSLDEAGARMHSGSENFFSSVEDFILHYCVRRFLCVEGQSYHVTDFSKGAMPVKAAGKGRAERYDRWYELLLQELNIVGPNAGIIAVGQDVAGHLRRRGFPRPVNQILHYSPLAGRARAAAIRGREAEFAAFADSLRREDFVAGAAAALADAGIVGYERVLAKLRSAKLSVTRQRLAFAYKVRFEEIRRLTGPSAAL